MLTSRELLVINSHADKVHAAQAARQLQPGGGAPAGLPAAALVVQPAGQHGGGPVLLLGEAAAKLSTDGRAAGLPVVASPGRARGSDAS